MTSVTSASQIFAWGASAYAVALFASMAVILMTQIDVIVMVLQERVHNLITGISFFACILLGIISTVFVCAGTVLTGIGLNTLAGGAGTMLLWALLVIGLPTLLLWLLAWLYITEKFRSKPQDLTIKRRDEYWHVAKGETADSSRGR